MNKAILCGRTTADIDIRMTPTGKKVCKFTLAIDDGKNADGSRRTRFIDCEAWNQSAEFMERYVKKGIRILVEGRLNKTSYEKDGQKHYPTNVVCDRIEFADGMMQTNSQPEDVVPMSKRLSSKDNFTNQRNADDFGIPAYDIDNGDLPF